MGECYECAFCGRVEYGSAEGIPGWRCIRSSPSHGFYELACPACVAAAAPWRKGGAS